MALSAQSPAIVWFRQDLRLADNPALHHAAASGRPLILLFILDESEDGGRPLGGAARWWLARSLQKLGESVAAKGNRLVLRSGSARDIVPALARDTGAGLVVWNRRYEAAAIASDTTIRAALKAEGIAVETFSASLLREPWTIKSQAGSPFKVFTPFWRALHAAGEPRPPLPAPAALPAPLRPMISERLDDWRLEPVSPNWASGFDEAWEPGEAGARDRLGTFLDESLNGYAATRDRPDRAATSRLSPYLRFGDISPVQIWHATQHAAAVNPASGAAKFLSEIGWREFSYHLLYHWPNLARENFQPRFDAFPWRSDPAALRRWQRGETGYPIVDAGMRQLWRTGWMHNRVRMIVASFLIKHLLIDWRAGEAWFWDTLVDADPASNAASWQWVAGTGADAAPYFRIFNPMIQGEKFDPAGDYVRHWVPELSEAPAATIHAPWRARDTLFRAGGPSPGRTYPAPIVDHDAARARALGALASIRDGAAD